eukprot:jgi/Tetstr1/436069/TSEL_002663.t1
MVIDVGGHAASYRPHPHADLSRQVAIPLVRNNMPKREPASGTSCFANQPDNAGADAAMQPEQHDDGTSEAELPELVADSDDEEDFMPCLEKDVPDHVANVIASCFALHASPMDADPHSDVELPDMVADSDDDDDVHAL